MSRKETVRKKLRDELTKRFVPTLINLGFVGPKRIAGNSGLHKFHRVTPNGVQCITINFDKWQQPRFALDFWVEPEGGFDALMKNGGTSIQGRAIPGWGRLTDSWFRADRPWWHFIIGLTSSREHEAVSSAIALLDEIEQWWRDLKPSKHITVIPSTFSPRVTKTATTAKAI